MKKKMMLWLLLGVALIGAIFWLAIKFYGGQILSMITSGAGVAIVRDVNYGPLMRHRMDIYSPQNISDDTPVLVFVHGGSWDTGTKDIYGFLAKPMAQQGYIVAVPNYRLYPEVQFPGFVEDVALAIAHLKSTLTTSLGDARDLVLMGHSAGAQIGALATYDGRYFNGLDKDACDMVQAFIGLAGPYDFKIDEERYMRIFPEETRPETQPLAYAEGAGPPALLLHGVDDTTVHAEDSTIFGQALLEAGNSARIKLYEGVDHLDVVKAFSPFLRGSAPSYGDVLAFLNEQKASSFAGCRTN